MTIEDEIAKEQFKQGKTREEDETAYACPLCMEIHEYDTPCEEMLDPELAESIKQEFKVINDLEEIQVHDRTKTK